MLAAGMVSTEYARIFFVLITVLLQIRANSIADGAYVRTRAENIIDWNLRLPCFEGKGRHPGTEPANVTDAMFFKNQFTGYKKLHVLGKGAYGVVYRVLRLADKKEFALKIARCDTLRTEYEITRSQQHRDFVIRVEEYGRTNNSFRWDYYVMQLVGKSIKNLWLDGQLKNVKQVKKMLNEMVVNIGIMHNLADGGGVAHGDLHLNNIAVHPEHKDRLVFFDFGFAEQITAKDAAAAFTDYDAFPYRLTYFEAPDANDTNTDPFKRQYALPHGASSAVNATTWPLFNYYQNSKPMQGAPPEAHAEWAAKRTAAYIRRAVQLPVERLFRSKYWIGENFGKNFLKNFVICNADTMNQTQANAPCWNESMDATFLAC